MLHVDLPTPSDIRALAQTRGGPCITLVLPTTPVTQDVEADRIAFGNLTSDAMAQLEAAGTDKRQMWPLAEQLDDLAEDDEFWPYMARSLVVFATPERLRTFRLPNRLEQSVEVSDRFNLAPLLRAHALPQQAVVLVLSEGAVAVYEIGPEGGVRRLAVPDLPADAAAVARKASLGGRAPKRRLQGSEGKKVHLRAYARRVDQALRAVLQGRDVPLLLVATGPMDAIYASVCSHAPLVTEVPAGATQHASEAELTTIAREMLEAHNRGRVAAVGARFAALEGARRATTKVTDAAHAATYGLVDWLAVDMDAPLIGTVDEDGRVAYAETPGADSYNVLGEIAVRALATGAHVVGARKDELPEAAPLAAILRRPV